MLSIKEPNLNHIGRSSFKTVVLSEEEYKQFGKLLEAYNDTQKKGISSLNEHTIALVNFCGEHNIGLYDAVTTQKEKDELEHTFERFLNPENIQSPESQQSDAPVIDDEECL